MATKIIESPLVLDQLAVAARITIPKGVIAAIGVNDDFIRDQLVYSLRAHVYGEKGVAAFAERRVTEARFPRWLPGGLRRRWSQRKVLRVDATPFLVFPDMEYQIPALGAPVRIAQHTSSYEDVA